MMYYQKHFIFCVNQKEGGKVCCGNHAAIDAAKAAKQFLTEQGLLGPGKMRVTQSGCLGRCQEGPAIVVYPAGVWYRYETLTDVLAILAAEVAGQPLKDYQLSSE